MTPGINNGGAARQHATDRRAADVAAGARVSDAQTRVDVDGTWPHGISHQASMRISQVLAALRAHFPAVTHSKLRFLEEQGLIDPVRTPSGYRQYSPADVERLRFVLTEQRDRYLPLKVIKEKLAALDVGDGSHEQPLIPRLVSRDGESEVVVASRLTVQRLAETAGVEVSLVESLVHAGLLRPDSRGHFDPWDQQVVVFASGLAEYGLEARHLRVLRAAAERHVDLVAQAVLPLRGQDEASTRARVETSAAELGELCAQLQTTWIRQGVATL